MLYSAASVRYTVSTWLERIAGISRHISETAVVFNDWEGNRRSGVALAMRYRLRWFIQLRAHGLSKGDEHPAYTLHGVWHTLSLTRL